jgi:cytochrome c553
MSVESRAFQTMGSRMSVRSAAAIAVAVAVLGSAGPVLAQELKGNAEAAKKKLAVCEGCHGIPGYRTAYPVVYHVPLLGGQQEAYLLKALQAYRSGERSHPSMRGIASGLSEQEMADLAAYYAGARK